MSTSAPKSKIRRRTRPEKVEQKLDATWEPKGDWAHEMHPNGLLGGQIHGMFDGFGMARKYTAPSYTPSHNILLALELPLIQKLDKLIARRRNKFGQRASSRRKVIEEALGEYLAKYEEEAEK